MKRENHSADFVTWFRQAAPYIHAHRGKTFVVLFGGAAVADNGFANIVHDIALLNSLGVRLVLVHGARPQIERRLAERNAEIRYVDGVRVTNPAAMDCVKEAAGTVRVEIEALLSMGVTNSPMAGARLRVSSGNFITAKPVGVRGGVDFLLTGEVRRVDGKGIRERLDSGNIVIMSPLGYSPTGEIFNVSADEIAAAVAAEIGADKLVCLMEGEGVTEDGELVRECNPDQCEELMRDPSWHSDDRRQVKAALDACAQGVKRAHLISRHHDGALLQELYTRDGVGTMLSGENWERVRPANIEDVGGILELIEPLENSGVLVRRPRELLELEIERFSVIERDGSIIGCAALYDFPEEKLAELACLAVHPAYRNQGKGDRLVALLEKQAQMQNLSGLFVLTTSTAQWFEERGFQRVGLDELPLQRRQLYNLQRNSRVYLKTLQAD